MSENHAKSYRPPILSLDIDYFKGFNLNSLDAIFEGFKSKVNSQSHTAARDRLRTDRQFAPQPAQTQWGASTHSQDFAPPNPQLNYMWGQPYGQPYPQMQFPGMAAQNLNYGGQMMFAAPQSMGGYGGGPQMSMGGPVMNPMYPPPMMYPQQQVPSYPYSNQPYAYPMYAPNYYQTSQYMTGYPQSPSKVEKEADNFSLFNQNQYLVQKDPSPMFYPPQPVYSDQMYQNPHIFGKLLFCITCLNLTHFR